MYISNSIEGLKNRGVIVEIREKMPWAIDVILNL